MPLYRVIETRTYNANVVAKDIDSAVAEYNKIPDEEKLVERIGPAPTPVMDDASTVSVIEEIVTDLKTNKEAPSGKMVIDYLTKKAEKIREENKPVEPQPVVEEPSAPNE